MGVSLLFWLYEQNYLLILIGIASILYLIFYFGLGTVMVFMASLEELGHARIGFSRSPLLTIVVLGMTVLFFWLAALMFWPLLLIPNHEFISKKNQEKFDAIARFEYNMKEKYHK